jgi:transcriptional regulator with XRE-family HTH domain
MQIKHSQNTTLEWEQTMGKQVRAARIAQDLDQSSLASMANISIGALSNLERGRGSSLATLIAVVRALGRTDWLETLAPAIAVSPLQMLRSRQKTPASRVRSRKATPPASRHL